MTVAPSVPDEIAQAIVVSNNYADLEQTVLPACAWLRENMPIGLAEVEGYDPVWMISRHADIREILRDAETYHNADVNIFLQPKAGDDYLRSLLDGTTHVLNNLSYMEPPQHTEYRAATGDVFLAPRVRHFENRLREIAKQAVDRFVDQDGECDFVEVLSAQFPLHAVMDILGIPETDYDLMLKLTQDTFGGEDPDWKRDDVELSPEAFARQWHASVQDFYAYFEDVRKDRLANPGDDLSSLIVNSKLANGELMPEKIQNHLTSSIALAGHDTTNSAIAAGMLGLLRYPEQFDMVKVDPGLIPGLVDEALRYATPAKHFMRNTTCDVEFKGIQFQKMQRIMCLLVSGNRDEEVFADPERFDVTRRPNPHLSFSFGPHICLGQHLARLEMRVLFEELLPRIDSIELAGEPKLKMSNFVSGLKTLPVRFSTA